LTNIAPPAPPKAVPKPIALTCSRFGKSFVAATIGMQKSGPIKKPRNATIIAERTKLLISQKRSSSTIEHSKYVKTARSSPRRDVKNPRETRPRVMPIQNPVLTIAEEKGSPWRTFIIKVIIQPPSDTARSID